MERSRQGQSESQSGSKSAPRSADATRGGRAVRWLVPAVAICALAALFWPRDEGAFEAPGGFLVDARGRPQPLAERLAPVTLVHFWASWCAPCLGEIPLLLEFNEALEPDDSFRLLLVAVNDEPATARAFIGESAPPLLFDPEWAVAHRFGTRALPETYLMVDGEVVHHFRNVTDWSDAAVRARVIRRLQEQREGATT